MGRQERRRAERMMSGATTPANVINYNQPNDAVARAIGVDIKYLDKYAADREKDLRRQVIEEFDQKLRFMETNATIANLIISMYAIKMTWGFTKSQQRFLENLRPAEEYIKRVGVQKAFDQIMKDCDTEIGFDDFGDLRNADEIIKEIYG